MGGTRRLSKITSKLRKHRSDPAKEAKNQERTAMPQAASIGARRDGEETMEKDQTFSAKEDESRRVRASYN